MAGEFSSHGADDTGGNTGGSQNRKKLGSKTPKIAFFCLDLRPKAIYFPDRNKAVQNMFCCWMKFIDLNWFAACTPMKFKMRGSNLLTSNFQNWLRLRIHEPVHPNLRKHPNITLLVFTKPLYPIFTADPLWMLVLQPQLFLVNTHVWKRRTSDCWLKLCSKNIP